MINWNLDFFEAAKGSDSFLGEFVDLDKLVYPFKVEDRHMGYLDCIEGWEVGNVFVPYGSERYDHLLGNF